MFNTGSPDEEERKKLEQFLLEETRNVEDVLNLTLLTEKFVGLEKYRNYHTNESRLRRFRQICEQNPAFDTKTKVKLMFGLGIPLSTRYFNMLSSEAIVKLDKERKMVFYDRHDKSIRLESSSYRRMQARSGMSNITPPNSSSSSKTIEIRKRKSPDVAATSDEKKVKKGNGSAGKVQATNGTVVNESAKEFSDVVLKVKDQNFYVNKMYLASHSTYFKTLFENSNGYEIELKDIEPQDFQKFLQVIRAEDYVNDDTVEGILHLAHKFDTKAAIRQCEKFLMRDSEKDFKTKFLMANQYKLENLKEKCMPEFKNFDDFESIAQEDHTKVEHGVWKELLNRCLKLFKKSD